MNESMNPSAIPCPCEAKNDPVGGDMSAFDCLAGMSLAMVYAPVQEFAGIYTPEVGLSHGTIFMALDKPFYGARRVK